MMVFPFLSDEHESNQKRLYARRLAEQRDSGFTRKLNALICALDTGILSVSFKEVDSHSFIFPDNVPDEIKRKIQEDYKYDIKTSHPLYDRGNLVGQELFNVEDLRGLKAFW